MRLICISLVSDPGWGPETAVSSPLADVGVRDAIRGDVLIILASAYLPRFEVFLCIRFTSFSLVNEVAAGNVPNAPDGNK